MFSSNGGWLGTATLSHNEQDILTYQIQRQTQQFWNSDWYKYDARLLSV